MRAQTPLVHDRSTLLHLLRDSFGWGDETVREARHMAADELERLWRNEGIVTNVIKHLQTTLPSEVVCVRQSTDAV